MWLCPADSALKRDFQILVPCGLPAWFLVLPTACMQHSGCISSFLESLFIQVQTRGSAGDCFLVFMAQLNTWGSLKALQRCSGVLCRKVAVPRINQKAVFPNLDPALGSHPTYIPLTALLPGVRAWKGEGSRLRKKERKKKG